jgi:hypothetical protein
MLKRFKQRYGFGLHFALTLLVFCELVAWGQAGRYTLLDWLALGALYIALAFLALDLLDRFQANDLPSLALVGGFFGVLRATVTSQLTESLDALATDALLVPMGVQMVMFVLAFYSFRLLHTQGNSGTLSFSLAVTAGVFWGIWSRWSGELRSVNLAPPILEDSLPYTLLGLLAIAISAALLQPLRAQADNWQLMPYEGALAGGILAVTFVLRLQDGYLSPFGVGANAALLAAMGYMLWRSRELRGRSPLAPLERASGPNLPAWLSLVLPFTLTALGTYLVSDVENLPLYANVTLVLWFILSIAWLPTVSLWLGGLLYIRFNRAIHADEELLEDATDAPTP